MDLSWKHVVPWANRSEFVQTYLDLYSKDVHRQKRAVDAIALWKCRASNKLAVAIDSSAVLTKAYLKYQSAVEGKKLHRKGDEVRMLMTLAIIRFVNHVTEKGQNKAFAQPVHKVAKEFGIPEWMVRMRHDGTHGPIPPLDVLARGVEWSLTYLQEVFWSHQVKEADEVSDPGTPSKRKRSSRPQYSTREIRELITCYQKASYKAQGDDPEDEAAREKRRTQSRLEHIMKGQERNNVLRCMVESGQLVATEQQLSAYHVNVEETLRADPPKVPEVVIKVWRDLLKTVQEKQLTRLLLQHMVHSLLGQQEQNSRHHQQNHHGAAPSSTHCLMLLAWIRLVLLWHASNYSKMSEERESQAELYGGPVEFSRHLLLASCLQNPNLLTCSLLRLVGDKTRFSEDMFRKLDDLNQVYKGNSAACPDKQHSDMEVEVKTEDHSKRTDSTNSVTNETAAVENIWKLRTEPIDREWVPIGMSLTTAYLAALARADGMQESSDSDSSSSTDDEDRRSRSSEEEEEEKKEKADSTKRQHTPEQDTKKQDSEEDDVVKKICLP